MIRRVLSRGWDWFWHSDETLAERLIRWARGRCPYQPFPHWHVGHKPRRRGGHP